MMAAMPTEVVIINSPVLVISVKLKAIRKMNAESGRLIVRKPAIPVARKVIQVGTADLIKTIKTMIAMEHNEMVPEAVLRPTITNHLMPTLNAS